MSEPAIKKALYEGDFKKTLEELNSGASPNNDDPDITSGYRSPLLQRALWNQRQHQQEIMELLIMRGADVNGRSSEGYAPIHIFPFTAPSSRSATLELLLRHKADINARVKDGNTTLHILVSHNRPDDIRALLEFKPDISIRNKKGQTALEFARSLGFRFRNCVELLEQYDNTPALDETALSRSNPS